MILLQVIRIGLMAKITLKDCPGLRALLDEFESLGTSVRYFPTFPGTSPTFTGTSPTFPVPPPLFRYFPHFLGTSPTFTGTSLLSRYFPTFTGTSTTFPVLPPLFRYFPHFSGNSPTFPVLPHFPGTSPTCPVLPSLFPVLNISLELPPLPQFHWYLTLSRYFHPTPGASFTFQLLALN